MLMAGLGAMGGMPDLGSLESFTGGAATSTSGDSSTGAINQTADHSVNFGNRAQNDNKTLYVVAGVAVLALLVWSKK